jgi:hypothetical protein
MIVTVSIAATVPIKATGRSILRVMSLSPEFGSMPTSLPKSFTGGDPSGTANCDRESGNEH